MFVPEAGGDWTSRSRMMFIPHRERVAFAQTAQAVTWVIWDRRGLRSLLWTEETKTRDNRWTGYVCVIGGKEMASFSRPGTTSQRQVGNSIQTAPLMRMFLMPKILNFWTGGDHHSIGAPRWRSRKRIVHVGGRCEIRSLID